MSGDRIPYWYDSPQQVNYQRQQQQQPYAQINNDLLQNTGGALNVLIEKGLVNMNALRQLTPQSRKEIDEQCIIRQQQNAFQYQVQSINDFYNKMNIKPAYELTKYQLQAPVSNNQINTSTKPQEINKMYPNLNYNQYPPPQERGFPLQQERGYPLQQNSNLYQQKNYLNEVPPQFQIQDGNQQSEVFYSKGRKVPMRSPNDIQEEDDQREQEDEQGLSQLSDSQKFPHLQNQFQIERQLHFQNDNPNVNSQYSFQQPQQQYSQQKQSQYSQSNFPSVQSHQRSVSTEKPPLVPQPLVGEEIDKNKISLKKNKKLVDYDEIFNLSSSVNVESMKNTWQFKESEHDRQFIGSKYHEQNKANSKQFRGYEDENDEDEEEEDEDEANENDSQKFFNNIEEQPIKSRGANKKFEELVDEVIGNSGHQNAYSPSNQKDSRGRKIELSQRYLKQGTGYGGKTSSVSGQRKQQKLNQGKQNKGGDEIKESEDFIKFEQVLREAEEKKPSLQINKLVDGKIDDIQFLRKIEEEGGLGQQVKIENVEIDSKAEKALIARHIKKEKLDEIDRLIKQLRNGCQRVGIYKNSYENNLRILEDKMKKLDEERKDLEEQKVEQQKLFEAEQRLLKKAKNQIVPEKGVGKTSEAKSLARYKEEAKELKAKLEHLQFDSKKKIEELQLTLQNTIKENKRLRKEAKQKNYDPINFLDFQQHNNRGDDNILDINISNVEEQKQDISQINKNINEPHDEEQKKNDDLEEHENKSKEHSLKKEDEIHVDIKKIPRTHQEWKIKQQKIKEQQQQQAQIESAEESGQEEKDVSIILQDPNRKQMKQPIQQKQDGKEGSFERDKSNSANDISIMTSASKMAAKAKLSQQKKKLGKITAKVDSGKRNKQNDSDTNKDITGSAYGDSSKSIPRQDPSKSLISGITKYDDSLSKASWTSSRKKVERSTRKLPLSLYKMIKNFCLEDIGKRIDISQLKYTSNKYYRKYLESKEQLIIPIFSEKEKDGTIACVFENDVKKTVYKDNTISYLFPSRYQIIFFTNGDIKQVLPNGIEHYYYQSNSSTQTTLPEKGPIIILFNNQQIEFIMPNQEKQVRFPDGMVKITQTSGAQKVIFPSGAIEMVDEKFIKTIISPEGHKTILYPDDAVPPSDK